jgi:hypothetical protein
MIDRRVGQRGELEGLMVDRRGYSTMSIEGMAMRAIPSITAGGDRATFCPPPASRRLSGQSGRCEGEGRGAKRRELRGLLRDADNCGVLFYVERRGIEPPFTHCERVVLPLNDLPFSGLFINSYKIRTYKQYSIISITYLWTDFWAAHK